MAVSNTLAKRYLNHFGINLKNTDLVNDRFATDMRNAQYRKTGSIEKRPGYQAHAQTDGGKGLFTYNRINPLTGLEEPEVVSVDTSLDKLLSSQILVTYVGVDPTAIMSVFYDVTTSQYRCQILEGTLVVLDQALGVGVDEVAPYTVNQLKTVIDALADFTATLTGATTTPAAFIRTVRDYDLVNIGPLTLTAKYFQAVNKTVSAPLNGSETHKNDADFELASFIQINNVIYIGNGYDETQKYDGQTLYRAGLPSLASITSALDGAGAVTGTNYYHRANYLQIDAVGNVIEGNSREVTVGLNPVAQSMNVTVANVLAGSGFNTDCAIVVGAQAAVNTITVDDGTGGTHTMQVGDTAYFFDGISAGYVERLVTAISATTITVAGPAVTVTDNEVISNNLRIAIFRNATSGTAPTTFFLVAEIANNSFAATQVYNDNLTDAQLGAQFLQPLTDRSAPPKGKYVSAFRNQMVIAGNILNPITAYVSDVESPEYFPSDSNQFDMNSPIGDRITGIAPNNEVFVVFKNKSVHVVSGDIASLSVRVDLVSTDVGCVAHQTIQEVKGTLFFLSDLGPRSIVGGQVPQAIGMSEGDPLTSRIDPLFDQTDLPLEQQFASRRAVAIHDRMKEKYLLFVPCESLFGGTQRFANSNSRVLAYDYTRDAWLKWTNLNMESGVTVFQDELYFMERRYSSFLASLSHVLYRRHNNNDSYDYEDNTIPVDWNYSSPWEALGEPSVLKHFKNIRIFSLEEMRNNDLSLDVKVEDNYTKDKTSAQFTFDFGGSGYGQSPYGTAPYGDPAEFAKKHKVNLGRVKSVRVIFENNLDQQNSIITGWEWEVATPYRPGFKT